MDRRGGVPQGLGKGVEFFGREQFARGAQLDAQPGRDRGALENVHGEHLGQAPLGGFDHDEGPGAGRGPPLAAPLGTGHDVEHDLGVGQPRKAFASLGIEVAQDAVPCGVRARAAGLLGGPQQRGQGGSAREQFVDVLAGQHAAVVVGVGTGVRGSPAQRVRGHVHGPLGREPPDGLGQVAARGEGVTTVALEGHRAQCGVG